MTSTPVIMATTVKETRTQTLMFDALEADGRNFLEWHDDISTYLCAEELDGALTHETAEGLAKPKNWQALLVIRRHMDASLRQQYIQVREPAELWSQLKARFKHEETLFLPQARNDWYNLRVLDFPNFQAFNAELHRVSAQLRLCGDKITDAELIDKTLSTFPPATAILSQQYRNMKFKRHSELMSYLLLAEKQQQILLKNAEARPAREIHVTEAPTPPAPPPAPAPPVREAHSTEAAKRSPRGGRGRGRGRDSRYYHGRDDQRYTSTRPDQRYNNDRRDYSRYNHDRHEPYDRSRSRGSQSHGQSSNPDRSEPNRGACHKCGRQGHYARECRTPEYFVEMYRELQKLKEEKREVHTLDAPSFNDIDPENYMVQLSQHSTPSDTALLDSASTHSIFRDPQYFESDCMRGPWQECNILTIAGSRTFKFREGRATIVLPGGFPLRCERAMYAPAAPRSLISYRDLRANGIHASTRDGEVDDDEALELRKGTHVFTTVKAGTTGLYELKITAAATNGRSCNLTVLPKAQLWHRRLGHPGTTIFRRMLPVLTGHTLSTSDADKVADCTACIQGKYAKHPSRWRLPTELPQPLQRLHGDICGPINPPAGQFLYFLVLVDASGSHSEVSLLTTRNMAFPKLLAMLIRFRTHFPDKPIKTLRMDNAKEFRSHAFEDYCTATGIELTYSVPYEHSQNGLAEAFIKKIQLITRPLLLHAHLPASMWSMLSFTLLLLRLRPTLNTQNLHYIGRVQIRHLRVFGCQVWIPAPEPQIRTIALIKTGEDPYRPCEEEEDEIDKQRYLAAVGALIYLATHTRPDIAFATSVLARHSRKPAHRHWAGIKHLLRYLRGTEDLGLHFTKDAESNIVGYADSGYRTDEVNGKSQTGYIFIKNGAPISWKSVKQTITATSTNHAELLALHEAAREAVWLRTMVQAISEQCKTSHNNQATVIYEDNAAAVAQVATGFIKADRVKHISPTLFGFMQDLVETGQVTITKIESANNISDMLTKALPAYKHRELVRAAGMRTLQELD